MLRLHEEGIMKMLRLTFKVTTIIDNFYDGIFKNNFVIIQ
jgi:hypothetical protein